MTNLDQLTSDQVFDSLSQAHEKGDKKSAQELADLYRELKAQEQTQMEAEDNQGMMPFVNQALASVAGAPADVLGAATSLIPGVDTKEKFGYTMFGKESIETAMDFYGMDVAKKAPTKPSEYIGRGVGEVAALMIPMGKTVQVLSRGTGLVGGIAKSV